MVHSCVYSGWLMVYMSLCAGEWLLHHTYLMADDYPFNLDQVLLHRRNFDVEHVPFWLSFHLIWDQVCSETSIYIQLHFRCLLRGVSIPWMTADHHPSVFFFKSTWLMYATNHWKCSVKESFRLHNQLFVKALS